MADDDRPLRLHKGGRPRKTPKPVPDGEQVFQVVRLRDMGISRKLSMKCQALARLPENEVERLIAEGRAKIENRGRAMETANPKKPSPRAARIADRIRRLEAQRTEIDAKIADLREELDHG